MQLERRSNRFAMEVRAASDKPRVITGYAAVFYRADDPATEFQLWEKCVERIHPGAFDAALREDDVRALFDHRSERVLGRRQPGSTSPTLRLSVDERGLKYEVDLPDDELGLAQKIERGDITGSSFGFMVETAWGAKRGRVTWEEHNGLMIRNVYDLELIDVGPVTFPAYAGATAESRSALLATVPTPQATQDELADRLLLVSSELALS